MLPVEVAPFLELVGNRIALLGEAAVRGPVIEEHAPYTVPRLREQPRTGTRVGYLARGAVGVFLLVSECTEQGKQHVVRSLVLRVQLHYGALEVLDGVFLAVQG